MRSLSRRRFSRSRSGGIRPAWRPHRQPCRSPAPATVDVHQQLLELAARQEERRRARFAAVTVEGRPGRAPDLAARDVSPSARRSSPRGPAFRRSITPGRSKPTITSSRSSPIRELPRLFRVGPALQAQDDRGAPCRASSALAAIRRTARPPAPTRSCTSTWRSAATSS